MIQATRRSQPKRSRKGRNSKAQPGPVGLLLDTIYDNTGDKATRLVMEKFFQLRGIWYEVLNPLNFDPSSYQRIIVGGGELIRNKDGGYYDHFRVPGPNILNAVGVTADRDLDYLNQYEYVAVRSAADRAILEPVVRDVQVVPCVALLTEPATIDVKMNPRTIGFHFAPATLLPRPDIERVLGKLADWSKLFIPFTHYNNDRKCMEPLAQSTSNASVAPYLQPEKLFGLIGQLDCLVASSLHACLFAYANNVPFVAIDRSGARKIEAFMTDRGLGEWLFEDGEDLAAKLERLLEHPPDYSDRIKEDRRLLEDHLDRVESIVKPGGVSLVHSGEGQRGRTATKPLLAHIQRLNDAVLQRDLQAACRSAQLANQLTDTEAALEEREHELGARTAALVQRDALLAEKDAALAEKDAALVQQQELLKQHKAALKDSKAALAQREQTLADVAHELEVIRRSPSYLLVSGLRRRLGELFPAGTLRGRALRKARRLARRSLDRRWREAVWQSQAPSAQDADYERWILQNEPTSAELDQQRESARQLPYQPIISIITPTYNTPPQVLRQTVESVLAQTYGNWELCIADGNSSQAVRRLLKQFAKRDRRIRVKFLKQNRGIAGNSNEALAMAEGDMVAFLDHDDLLAPFSLFEISKLLNRNPGLDLIYSDHDFLSEDGKRRYGAQFKPEWSPDMLISANYVVHLSVLRRKLVEQLGGLRPEVEGAQDWDLLLRAGEQTDRIARIPKVLYHWRALRSSFAGAGFEAKPYQKAALQRTISEHLARRGLQGDVVIEDRGGERGGLFVRIKWAVTGRPKVSAIIPTKHNRKLLERCLRSLLACAYPNLEIIVIETAGRTRAREAWYRYMQEEIPLRILWWNKPFNWSAVCNWGAREAEGEMLLFLNDDAEILTPDSLEEMLGWVQQPDVGCVGAQLLSPDGAIQHGGMTAGMFGFADYLFRGARQGQGTLLGSTGWYRNLLAVSGACNMVRREVFEEVGGWDDSFILCGSDSVFCFRLHEAGYRVLCTPYAKVLHREGATRGKSIPREDFYTSYWPYQKYLRGGDPYFNPNLSLFNHVPRLKSPGEDSAVTEVSRILGRDLTPARQRIEEESRILSEACKIPTELGATFRLHGKTRGQVQVKSINWFIPDFETPFYGGIHTILRFADYFRRNHNVKSRFVVLGVGPEEYVRSGLRLAFPALADSDVVICSPWNDDEIRGLPGADVAIATQWLTAYVVARTQRTRRKFYMIQDFEPMFYPAGTVYALAEQTYRMGLYGIASGPTLKEMYKREYGGSAIHYNSCVDISLFHPSNNEQRSDGAFRLFLFGRPGHWRSCYELAMSALAALKARWKDQLHIITAGSWAVSSDAVGASIVDNLGLLDYRATPDLYRSCDAGLVLTTSRNPSYVTLEIMASGSLLVSNRNPAASWLLRDGENCLLTEPTVESLCQALEKGMLDRELRRRLTNRAVADIREHHSDWEPEMEKVYQYLCDPDAQLTTWPDRAISGA